MDQKFKRWNFSSDLSPSAAFELRNVCGIYVLEFANGDEYVGQSVNFPSRLTAHRRHYPDIVAVNFREVPRSLLNESEASTIRDRLSLGKHLRNKTLLAQPLGASPLDAVIDQQVQLEWLSADVDDSEIVFGDRAAVARRRSRFRKQFEALAEHSDYAAVLDALSVYVALVIPWSHQTEGRIWTVSAMPSTGRRKDSHRLATLSVNNVEVLVLAEWLERGRWCPWTMMNIAGDTSLPRDLAAGATFGTFYRSAGRTGRLVFDDYPVPDILEVPEVMAGARRLCMGQLRKGSTMFSRFHNDDLADAIYLRMDEMFPEEEPEKA